MGRVGSTLLPLLGSRPRTPGAVRAGRNQGRLDEHHLPIDTDVDVDLDVEDVIIAVGRSHDGRAHQTVSAFT